jgi:hypothetical protein
MDETCPLCTGGRGGGGGCSPSSDPLPLARVRSREGAARRAPPAARRQRAHALTRRAAVPRRAVHVSPEPPRAVREAVAALPRGPHRGGPRAARRARERRRAGHPAAPPSGVAPARPGPAGTSHRAPAPLFRAVQRLRTKDEGSCWVSDVAAKTAGARRRCTSGRRCTRGAPRRSHCSSASSPASSSR